MLYKLVAKLYDKDKLVGYRLLNISTNKTYDEDIQSVKILAHKGLINGVVLTNRNRLRSTNDTDLRSLQRVKVFESKLSTFVIGSDLKSLCSKASKYKHRYCFRQLKQYLSSNTPKICTIYGLRRTGKTYLMLQAIHELNYSNCAYISLSSKDKSFDLLGTLKYCVSTGIKYIFIDEITALSDLFYFVQTLADNYAMRGIRIVVSGTDSYMLNLASNDVLYDRCIMLRTTYVSFNEYNYLMGATDIKDYIRYGGILSRQDFYDTSRVHDYMSTAISDNIQHSVEVSGSRKFGTLYDLVNMGLFKRCLEMAIQRLNNKITARILADEFKSQDIGSVKQLLMRVLDISSVLDLDEIVEQIRYYLRIVSHNRDTDTITEVLSNYYDSFLEMLKALDLITYVKHYERKVLTKDIVFTLPGLQYNQLKETLSVLLQNTKFQELNKDKRNLILNKLETDVYGQLAEQVILLELQSRFGFDMVYKMNGVQNEEIDCIVELENKFIDLIEVKWSTKVVNSQCVHLVNGNFNDFIEKWTCNRIQKRIVVYRGKTCTVDVNGLKINYINMNEFLLNPNNYL